MKREHLGIVALALLSAMSIMPALDLLQTARTPGVVVDGVRVVVMLTWGVIGGLVGLTLASLTSLLDDRVLWSKPDRPARLAEVSAGALALGQLSLFALLPSVSLVHALASCLAQPSEPVTLWPAIAGGIFGFSLAFVSVSCLLTVLRWRRARAEATHQPGLNWDVSLLEPLS